MLVTTKRGCSWGGEEGCSWTGTCFPVPEPYERWVQSMGPWREKHQGHMNRGTGSPMGWLSQISITTSLVGDFTQPCGTHATLVATAATPLSSSLCKISQSAMFELRGVSWGQHSLPCHMLPDVDWTQGQGSDRQPTPGALMRRLVWSRADQRDGGDPSLPCHPSPCFSRGVPTFR